MIQQFLTGVEHISVLLPSNLMLWYVGMRSENIHTKNSIQIFTVTLFTMTQIWKQYKWKQLLEFKQLKLTGD